MNACGNCLGWPKVADPMIEAVKDKTVEFTEGLSGFKAQDFHRKLPHDVTHRGAEELGRGGFEQLLIEGFIIAVGLPQRIELTMQIGNRLDLLGGHGGDDREAQVKRCDEALALGKSEFFAALIEDDGIEDRLEIVGHRGKLRLLHPTFLSLIEGV